VKQNTHFVTGYSDCSLLKTNDDVPQGGSAIQNFVHAIKTPLINKSVPHIQLHSPITMT
jgi:hypothetical protein